MSAGMTSQRVRVTKQRMSCAVGQGGLRALLNRCSLLHSGIDTKPGSRGMPGQQ